MAPSSPRRSFGIVLVSLLAGVIITLALLQLRTLIADEPVVVPVTPSREATNAQADEVLARIDSLAASTAPVDAPATGQLDRAGYQQFLDYVRLELGVEMAREITTKSADVRTSPELLRRVAASIDPTIAAYRRVKPPADTARAHRALLESQVAYRDAMLALAADPASAAVSPEQMSARLAKLPEVAAMWAAHAKLTKLGYAGDPRTAP